MSNNNQLSVDLRQMVVALETAVDLVGMNDTNHGKRVGFMAVQIAHLLGFPDESTQFIFELGMLHDCGVSTEQMHSNLVNHFDWEESNTHCVIGSKLLEGFAPLKKFSLPILYHHTRWEELKDMDIPIETAKYANLIFLVDRIDVTAAAHYEKDILSARPTIFNSIENYVGTYFDPVIYEAFLEAGRSEAFWIALEDRNISRFCWDMGKSKNKIILTTAEVKQLSLIFSYVVDQKSPFTAQHSEKVGLLARYLAKLCGLSEEHCDMVEIAGYLHDLGKLHIPDNILEKAGPLTNLEKGIMNQHSYETYEILRYVDGMGDIAKWAAYHHENLDRTGYPFHPEVGDLGVEARILAVVDVFQALIQDRPYRNGMKLEEALDILGEMVKSYKLDPELVRIINQNSNSFFDLASDYSNTQMPIFAEI